MDGSLSHLRLFAAAAEPAAPPAVRADPRELANRELLRPPTYRRGHDGLEPFSGAWLDELAAKRYQRHGAWLPAALEFDRHPDEAVLVLGPGVGCDAARYAAGGSVVTVAVSADDRADVVRDHLDRRGLSAAVVPFQPDRLPAADGTVDVVAWNALHSPAPAPEPGELLRVLKSGGKVIGLFPARYDAGYWQDVLFPLQGWYWRRPPDPTSAPKATGRELLRAFAGFEKLTVAKRHLRRSELPHPWRVLPLMLMERLMGRVLVLKAFKPLAARTGTHTPLPAVARAA
ncbi:MAG: class I SAM-dependent methyltransferase [Gemmataceae bacterium]